MPYQSLYKHLFHTEMNDPTGPEAMKQVTGSFPYFGLGHFFLLKQSNTSEPGYPGLAAKAALHFNNIFLLNRQLNSELRTAPEQQPTSPVPEHSIEKSTIVEEKPEPVADIVTEAQLLPADQLVFEPLHTTDYFASQGIRLTEELQATDKLGKQLKSFTEWLKTMKKVHENKLPTGSEPTDISIQHLAEKSNVEGEVLTEAMAEAYLLQGKKSRAKEVYEKLSLLNPAKSAFFAAKIVNLNEK